MKMLRLTVGPLAAGLMVIVASASCKLWPESRESGPSRTPFTVQLRHPGIDPNHPKAYTLFQMNDAGGMITGYRMNVDSVSCQEDVCQIALVTMTWDALGQYTGFTVEKGTSLEKVATGETSFTPVGKVEYVGVPFTDDDNNQLHAILNDKGSVLKTLNFQNLVAVRDGQKMDAVSGATPLSVQEAVIEGAALTSYHLWHWANGDVQRAARNITSETCTPLLLSTFLSSGKDHYVMFAIDTLTRKNWGEKKWITRVNQSMCTGGRDRIKAGYAYLTMAIPEKADFFDNLGTLVADCNANARVHLLNLLSSEDTLPANLFERIADSLSTMDSYGEIHGFLSLLEKHDYTSDTIFDHCAATLDSPNFFVSRRAYWYLEKQVVNDDIKQRLNTYRKKCQDEGRVL